MVQHTSTVVRTVQPEDTEKWLLMRLSLWPETDAPQHRKEIAMMLSTPERFGVFVCEDDRGALIGFAEISLREWAEGCLSSPVGYVEGWFVEPSRQRQGIGAKLVQAGENWARAQGCTEMASDTNLGNRVSEAAHQKLGYEVAGEVIAFRKALEPCK